MSRKQRERRERYEERDGLDRRSPMHRRVMQLTLDLPDRRMGGERRKGARRTREDRRSPEDRRTREDLRSPAEAESEISKKPARSGRSWR